MDEQADDDASSESVPPDNAAEDMRPTRRYQAVLLFAGFMMIFQVIGINQTYGIFQVGGTLWCLNFHRDKRVCHY